MEFTIEPSYKSGLTRRSILGILYAAVVVQPAVIWVYLATGNLILSAAIYAFILLFSELAAFSGTPLSKQEILMMIGCSMAATGSSAMGPFPDGFHNQKKNRKAKYTQVEKF